jgi:SAM-dependent methyltransferase
MKSTAIGAAYDALLPSYISERHLLKSTKYVHKLLNVLRPSSRILDLGCGAGEPVDDLLLDAGHTVIGLDISEKMIAAARENCPAGEYYVRDIATLQMGEFAADAVVSFYTLFHVPRTLHSHLLRTIRSFLPRNGWLLITMGDKDFEGVTDWYGQKMWWSQWGPEKNRILVTQAGFEIAVDEIDHSGAENHHIILAQAA